MTQNAIVLTGPKGCDTYRESCLVDSATNLPILLPVTPELDKIREAAAKSAKQLLEALQH